MRLKCLVWCGTWLCLFVRSDRYTWSWVWIACWWRVWWTTCKYPTYRSLHASNVQAIDCLHRELLHVVPPARRVVDGYIMYHRHGDLQVVLGTGIGFLRIDARFTLLFGGSAREKFSAILLSIVKKCQEFVGACENHMLKLVYWPSTEIADSDVKRLARQDVRNSACSLRNLSLGRKMLGNTVCQPEAVFFHHDRF